MDKQYLFDSERLLFKTWGEEDIKNATQLWGDNEVTEYIGGPFSLHKIEDRLRLEMDNQVKYRIQYWPLYLKGDDEFIGCCGLRPYKDETTVVELGFHLRKNYWRKGYASEAAQRVLDYSFNDLKMKKVFAGHNPKNGGSRSALLKLGFRYVRDEYYPPTGLYHPSYELEQSEYKNILGK
jgi:RimJ/RimL family protein N-acetyltransferase